jgi:hypothetical protein
MLATGVGTADLPGTLTFAEDVGTTEATTLIYKDDGSLWTAQG